MRFRARKCITHMANVFVSFGKKHKTAKLGTKMRGEERRGLAGAPLPVAESVDGRSQGVLGTRKIPKETAKEG